MPLRSGSLANLGAAVLLGAVGFLCVALGRWQWHRAAESRETAARFAVTADLAPLTSAPPDFEGQRYRRLRLHGEYVPERQFLLDNIVEDGRAGYEVLTPFRPSDGGRWLLVNRGWLPANPDRRVLPEVAVDSGERDVEGRIDRLPRPGLTLGGGAAGMKTEALTVLSYPTAAELAERLGRPVYPYQLLLDARESVGFAREWRPAGLGPERHLAYAGQWWLFACGAVGAAVALVWRASEEADMKYKSIILWLIGLACIGPFVLAAILYYGPWQHSALPTLPGVRELVQPPVALPPAWFDEPAASPAVRYRWSLIYARIAACDQQCVADLERLRQVHLALGSEVDRVRRVYLYTGDEPQFPDDRQLLVRRLDDDRGAPVLGLLGEDRLRAGRVYIADPSGNLVVSYPPSAEQKELLRDLQRLLAVSRTG